MDELQLLVNQEARATTGCFRTTNLGVLSMESGLRSAAAQLESRQRRFGLRLLSLPQGDQAREIVGAPAAIGRRLARVFTDAQAAIRRMASEEPGPGQQYALRAREHIACGGPGRVSPSRFGGARHTRSRRQRESRRVGEDRSGSQTPAGGMAELLGPDGGTPNAAPTTPANPEREISEKKWIEARRWAEGRASRKKYRMPESHKPDGTAAGSTKRPAPRHHQPKAGHCRTGQNLHWAKVRPTAQCWWYRCPSQTRDHLFKVCPEWKMQQKIPWVP